MEKRKRSCRILVVDDDNQLCELVGRRMRRAGHFVVTAESAEVALAHAALGRPPFDVVITDVHMPGMNGLDLATKLIERRPTQRVVIVTGDPDEALAHDAISRGPVSYLLKPFELFELEAVVNQALAAPRFASPAPRMRDRAEPTIGTVPAEWLLWVDDRSYAGVGHSDRVARMARVIALAMTFPFSATALAELEVAAWSHEIGLLSGPSPTPSELAWRSSEILLECGSSESVALTVRHMHERWDGSGSPSGLRGMEVPGASQVLSAADSLDHYAAAWTQAGIDADVAAERAIGLVIAQRGTCYNPEVALALQVSRNALHSICAVERRVIETETPTPKREFVLL